MRRDVEEALGVPEGGLALGDDLVDHGLDSLRLMQLVEGWRERGIDVDFAELAADPRLEAWVPAAGG